MISSRVSNLDKMVEQLQMQGIKVTVDDQELPYGRIARLHDPEANPVGFWEPVS